MAKLKYGNALGNWTEIGTKFTADGEFFSTSKKAATWIDDITGNKMLLEGDQLKFKGDTLVSGDVTKVVFTDFEGAEFGTFTGDFTAKQFSSLSINGVDRVVEKLSAGNDKMIGSANNDSLDGGKGNDTIKAGDGTDIISGGVGADKLFGGSGSDFFLFGKNGQGDDIIFDFDANGGGSDQDYLSIAGGIGSMEKDGDNTVIEHEGGTITLVGVDPSEINFEDFDFPAI